MKKDPFAEDLFVDSGAWSLFRLKVLKTGKKASLTGLTGRELEAPLVQVGQGDFSYYDLQKGSDFRAYCDNYASFMKAFSDRVTWFANVDVIGNPDLTWEVQKFFEQEHGLTPVPVVHFGTRMNYLERYLEKGYEMVGLGGFATRPNKFDVIKWCDEAFLRICPENNKRLPITKIHGFAMTSWHLMQRWPWYSVDSTSWLLYGIYGLICVPRWKDGVGFRFDRPPMIVSVSLRGRPIDWQNRMHITNTMGPVKEQTEKWLKYIGLQVIPKTKNPKEELIENDVASNRDARAGANLRYYMEMEERLPRWPWPLSNNIKRNNKAAYHRGFGLV